MSKGLLLQQHDVLEGGCLVRGFVFTTDALFSLSVLLLIFIGITVMLPPPQPLTNPPREMRAALDAIVADGTAAESCELLLTGQIGRARTTLLNRLRAYLGKKGQLSVAMELYAGDQLVRRIPTGRAFSHGWVVSKHFMCGDYFGTIVLRMQ